MRVYAPVGTHEELLPYLVRRLLENGANSSFVHQFMNPQIPVEQVVRDPLIALTAQRPRRRACASRARSIGAERANSAGEDFGDPAALAALEAEVRAARAPRVTPAVRCSSGAPARDAERAGELAGRHARDRRTSPAMPARRRSTRAMAAAAAAQPDWDATPAAERAACLERAAELLQQRRGLFLSLLVREAGKTLPDAVAELREAVDFCRYYAARGRELFGAPLELPGPTGERNTLVAARPRRVRVHQPVELPAGDLQRADHRGAGRPATP